MWLPIVGREITPEISLVTGYLTNNLILKILRRLYRKPEHRFVKKTLKLQIPTIEWKDLSCKRQDAAVLEEALGRSGQQDRNILPVPGEGRVGL